MKNDSTKKPIDWSATKGPILYRRAKQIIPGGTQLLSKRPENFLPNQWPAYHSRAKGCEVWDLDGRRFIDMYSMGIGSCALGYADPDVNEAVKACIDAASMTTLNAPEEVELAELLLELHPWAGGARFTRSGGEAMAVAVRIARAYTKRQMVAVCGYHGWSDWYLAANLSSDAALDGHLIPGLAPTGVPDALRGTTLTFTFETLDELRSLVAKHGRSLAAVIMEPMRYEPAAEGMLFEAARLARGCGAVFGFDEITAGWRHHLGGLHLRFGVEPDLAVFGKAMSNGFPMGAIIGRSEVMQAAQESFISSTFWTERTGPTAAVATIRKMRRIGLPAILREAGLRVQEGWYRLAERHGVPISVHGWPALIKLAFDYGDQSLAVRTLFTQELLDRGYLASGGFYASAAQTPEIIDDYLSAAAEAFAEIRSAVDSGEVIRRLRGPVAQSGFQRLTK